MCINQLSSSIIATNLEDRAEQLEEERLDNVYDRAGFLSFMEFGGFDLRQDGVRTVCGLLSSLSRHRNELPSTRVCCIGVVWRLGISNWVIK